MNAVYFFTLDLLYNQCYVYTACLSGTPEGIKALLIKDNSSNINGKCSSIINVRFKTKRKRLKKVKNRRINGQEMIHATMRKRQV